MEHHSKVNRRLTWGYDPENRHIGRNDVLYFSPSAVSCLKSNVNTSLRSVWTRKLHDSDRIFFVTISEYGRFYFIGLITSIYRGKVEFFLLLNPYMYTQFIEQSCEAGGMVWLEAISSDVTIVTVSELPRSWTKLVVEAWVAANHDSVRLCTAETWVEVEVSLSQLAATCINDFNSHFKTYRYE